MLAVSHHQSPTTDKKPQRQLEESERSIYHNTTAVTYIYNDIYSIMPIQAIYIPTPFFSKPHFNVIQADCHISKLITTQELHNHSKMEKSYLRSVYTKTLHSSISAS